MVLAWPAAWSVAGQARVVPIAMPRARPIRADAMPEEDIPQPHDWGLSELPGWMGHPPLQRRASL